MTTVASPPEHPIEPGIGPVGLADRAADQAVHTGTPVALPAMDEAERALVSRRLRWRTDLVARTAGEGTARHLVVIPI